ncbi:MAG TPA: response regulator transcription factor [Ginsengibacter sp.]|nr:response regulator transcription factor [Chitinophagaceae bacterium]MCZ2395087.1 response regulator transcription factor [Chitinophagales bacterium]HRN72822.1 response regulator transcription factor [Ginsengibacter sp.]HRP18410.1 response regulator transcription factor [Ginsengibacter sp.]HRP43401.1 response regulator transcription factor [Ginsengibacter sp.]
MTPDTLKVAIADDHQIFRSGVILSLKPYSHIKFVLEASNGQELIDGIEKDIPDIVLLDLRMPEMDGIETTKYLNKHYPQIRILILTMFEDERFVGHLMDSGANGYLLKSTDPSEIVQAFADVMENGFYLNNFVNRVLIKKNYAKQKFSPNLNSELTITDKEKEVLSLVCMEFTAQEIAQRMNISPRTVEAIKDRLMERFGVKNSVGLVFFAMKNSLID